MGYAVDREMETIMTEPQALMLLVILVAPYLAVPLGLGLVGAVCWGVVWVWRKCRGSR